MAAHTAVALDPPERGRTSARTAVGAWVAGLIVLAAVIGTVLSVSELEEVARLLRRIRLEWLLGALTLQSGTYVCAAGVWRAALAALGARVSIRSLIPLSLAMLFVNQAVPSAGLSGSAVVLKALGRRGIDRSAAMAALLVGFVTAYIAYLIAVAISLVVLAALHLINAVLITTVIFFVFGAVAFPVGIVWYTRAASAPQTRRRLGRVPVLGPVLIGIAIAPADVLRNRSLMQRGVALQCVEIMLDGGTLYVTLRALGVSPFPPAVCELRHGVRRGAGGSGAARIGYVRRNCNRRASSDGCGNRGGARRNARVSCVHPMAADASGTLVYADRARGPRRRIALGPPIPGQRGTEHGHPLTVAMTAPHRA